MLQLEPNFAAERASEDRPMVYLYLCNWFTPYSGLKSMVLLTNRTNQPNQLVMAHSQSTAESGANCFDHKILSSESGLRSRAFSEYRGRTFLTLSTPPIWPTQIQFSLQPTARCILGILKSLYEPLKYSKMRAIKMACSYLNSWNIKAQESGRDAQ